MENTINTMENQVMENINTNIRYEVTENLDNGRFAAKKYDWWIEDSVAESCDCGSVEIGIRNCRLVERVMDITFSVPNEGFKPEIGKTYEPSMYYRVYNVREFHDTMKPTGRAIAWNEPFVSYFSEDNSSMQDVSFSVDDLFDIVSKMKNTSTEKTVINQSM